MSPSANKTGTAIISLLLPAKPSTTHSAIRQDATTETISHRATPRFSSPSAEALSCSVAVAIVFYTKGTRLPFETAVAINFEHNWISE